MSSDQPTVNAQTVEQTKQQIRSLVGEIAQLSKSDVSAEEYYAAFMQRIVSALAAVGGAVWLVSEGHRPELAYQINLSEVVADARIRRRETPSAFAEPHRAHAGTAAGAADVGRRG